MAFNLRTHLKTNSGKNSHRCNQCGYVSAWADALRKHFKTHSGEKSHKCNQSESVLANFYRTSLLHCHHLCCHHCLYWHHRSSLNNNDHPNPIPSISIHLYNWMNLHQSNLQSISELVSSQSVDKARQWSDSGLIKLLNDILVWSIEKTWPFAFLPSSVWTSNLSSQESRIYFNVSKLNLVHEDW